MDRAIMDRAVRNDITKMLPIGAWLKGLRLISVGPKYSYDRTGKFISGVSPGTVCLLSYRGNILHEWGHTPILGEVDDVCKEVLA